MPTYRDTTTPPSPFSTGPYTDEPITDGVTPHTPMDKRSKRILWVIAFLLVITGIFIGSLMQPDNPKADARTSIPACKEEDGSTQELCSFEGSNGRIINMDYGHYSFYVATGTLTDFGGK